MSIFQIVLTCLFVASLLLVYGKNLSQLAQKLLTVASTPAVQPSIAISLVDDIKAVTQLRDRLAAEGCADGVEACTVLLRVIVEYQEPAKGVV
jgi:phosphomannomutase